MSVVRDFVLFTCILYLYNCIWVNNEDLITTSFVTCPRTTQCTLFQQKDPLSNSVHVLIQGIVHICINHFFQKTACCQSVLWMKNKIMICNKINKSNNQIIIALILTCPNSWAGHRVKSKARMYIYRVKSTARMYIKTAQILSSSKIRVIQPDSSVMAT